ncbi:MAG TPA: glycosyltransferase family 2 protein [Vicinamibacterales bacterium]|nr:glycosyltransferase family 2 protein [Vicinamibacterales bacterium]
MTSVDVVVAVSNEETTIAEFIRSIRRLILPAGTSVRMTFVEDSSHDRTKALLAQYAGDRDVQGFALSKGYGQGPAVYYGVQRSDADAIIMMDVDGSHPVAAIPSMIEAFVRGAPVVQCRRIRFAGRRPGRAAVSELFRYACWAVSGFDFATQNVYFRLISKDVAHQLSQRPEIWWFLRVPWHQWQISFVELPVDVVERSHGASKYSFWRLLRFGLDGIACVISRTRLAAIVAGCVVVSGLVATRTSFLLAVPPVSAAALLFWRYRAVRRGRTLRALDGIRIGAITVGRDAPAPVTSGPHSAEPQCVNITRRVSPERQ